MSKDQAIGGAIFVVCLLVAVLYIAGMFFYPTIRSYVNIGTEENVRYWLVAVPVLVAFVAVLFIGAWIGWTMATTPPPKPIEEITTEIEEKKEEVKAEEPAEPQMPEAPAAPTEEKMPERKRKTEKPQ
jgi:predicted DNA-binding transcriptional regulator